MAHADRSFASPCIMAVALLGLVSLGNGPAHVEPRSTQGAPIQNPAADTPDTPALRGDISPILPILMIDVGGREVIHKTKTHGSLKVIEQHDGTLKDLATRPVSAQSRISIEIRGDTTVILPKKSYDIELVDERGRDLQLPLVGLPPDSDWALHGCGKDRTCLRNALVYAMAREFGRFAPRTRFIELFLDGDYRGVYLLVERVRRDGHRVDLPRPAADATTGDMTGGYIFKMDLAQGSPDDPILRDWVSKVSPMVYSYHYPRFDQITAAQKAYLQDHVANFEQLMMSDRWNDPRTGYGAWLDVPSWVDFALIQELSNNVDGYVKSVYLQKWPESRGNRIALGPVWDFDNAFGVADFRDARRTDVWTHRMNRFGTEGVRYDPPGRVPYVPAYWERLWTDPAFHTHLQCRWQELRDGPLLLANLTVRIDDWTADLALAQPRDDAAWNQTDSFQDVISNLKDWLSDRLAWLDKNLPGTCPR